MQSGRHVCEGQQNYAQASQPNYAWEHLDTPKGWQPASALEGACGHRASGAKLLSVSASMRVLGYASRAQASSGVQEQALMHIMNWS